MNEPKLDRATFEFSQDGIVEGILCGNIIEEQTCGGEIKRTVLNE